MTSCFSFLASTNSRNSKGSPGSQRGSKIRGKLRNASRMKLSLSIKPAKCFNQRLPHTRHVIDCYDAVIDLCEDETEKSLSGSIKLTRPDLALKASQLLKKLAGVRKGQFIGNKDLEGIQNINMFLALFKDELGDWIAAVARQNIQERKYNQQKRSLPPEKRHCKLISAAVSQSLTPFLHPPLPLQTNLY